MNEALEELRATLGWGVAGGRLGAAGVRLWLWVGVAWERLGVHWGSV